MNYTKDHRECVLIADLSTMKKRICDISNSVHLLTSCSKLFYMFLIYHRHLGSQLVELEKLIDKMLQDEFSRFIAADLHRPLDERTPPEEVGIIPGW